MKIYIYQSKPLVGDFAHNLGNIMSNYKQAMQAKSDIMLLPELAVSGYMAEDLFNRQDFITAIEESNRYLISQTKNTALIVPTVTRKAAILYNSAIVAQNGKIIGTTCKNKLPNYGVFDEKRYFSPGKPQIIKINGINIGIPICEDLWSDEVCKELKYQGAQIFLSPNASPFEHAKERRRQEVLKARYQENNIPIIYCNQVIG
ncbi:MAG: hypothetical protein DGJ47_000136, partial [Rickettsiaceae bacterium]